jgi:hypothetical protein
MPNSAQHPDIVLRCAFMSHICARAVETAKTPAERTERLKLARSYINLAWRADRANRAKRRARKGPTKCRVLPARRKGIERC